MTIRDWVDSYRLTTLHLLIAHAACAWFLTGLIWVIQLVHYPLFDHVGAAEFPAYALAHTALITHVVAPVMLLEMGFALVLLFRARSLASPIRRAIWLGALLLALIWGSTALVQVPLHVDLARGFDADAHASLVVSNWLRTLAWSVRALLAAWILARFAVEEA